MLVLQVAADPMLHLSYTLHNQGFATASIGDGDVVIHTYVSFLSDGLGDFARAAAMILRSGPEATFRWQQELGEHSVLLTRDGETIGLTVLRFADTFATRRDGETLLTLACPLQEFATASINCLRRVLDTHGPDGYRAMWKHHEFPLQQYRGLLHLRRVLPGVR